MSLRLSGGRRLQSPSGDTARPTPSRVRLALMNILAAELPGCRWLDLCSGSGVMACEALQRGAAAVVAVEQDRRHAGVARTNLDAVRAGLASQPSVRVHCAEVERWLRRAGGDGRRHTPGADRPGATAGSERGFDLIYADPPYAAGLYPAISAAVAAGGWLQPSGTLILECSSRDIPALEQLSGAWILRDQRTYGSTSVLMLQPPSTEPRRY